jgi:hypothetical protein
VTYQHAELSGNQSFERRKRLQVASRNAQNPFGLTGLEHSVLLAMLVQNAAQFEFVNCWRCFDSRPAGRFSGSTHDGSLLRLVVAAAQTLRSTELDERQ